MTYLPVVRVEQDIVYVKTIRGIEPARNMDNCKVTTGDFAICKSINQELRIIGVE